MDPQKPAARPVPYRADAEHHIGNALPSPALPSGRRRLPLLWSALALILLAGAFVLRAEVANTVEYAGMVDGAGRDEGASLAVSLTHAATPAPLRPGLPIAVRADGETAWRDAVVETVRTEAGVTHLVMTLHRPQDGAGFGRAGIGRPIHLRVAEGRTTLLSILLDAAPSPREAKR